MERPTWHETFSDMCRTVLKRSTCIKYQTSSIIVKGTQIIAFGYNGTASGSIECNDYWKSYHAARCIKNTRHTRSGARGARGAHGFDRWIKTREFKELHSKWSVIHELHAEMNALQYITKKDIDDTCAMYTYLSPCEQCAKHILAYGIKTLYYQIEYCGKVKGIISGLEYLKNNGVSCIKL